MNEQSTTEAFADFLSAHRPIADSAALSVGTVVGEWRIAVFLGRGGSGEVYRVEHVRTGQIAALKIHLPNEAAGESSRETSRKRFLREVNFLSKNTYPFFPKFYDAGESKGHPYLVIELLDARDLPKRDRAVAAFMLKLCQAVRFLHRRGFVHRDIKPPNILWRKNGEPVLIDLGLLKETHTDAAHPWVSVTLVDGRAVGAGTPHYAAPEQFGGGAISAATDIHALGVLIDDCFGGNPPRDWNRIVRRSTSSLPEHRYGSVDELMQAIRLRHVGRNLFWICCVALVAAALYSFYPRDATKVARQQEADLWQGMCENIVTNLPNRGAVPVSVIRLESTKEEVPLYHFNFPIQLAADREWWIVGPGILYAAISGEKPETRIVLDNCTLINATRQPPQDVALRYVFRKWGKLNFNHVEVVGKTLEELWPQSHMKDYTEGFDPEQNYLLFGVPLAEMEILERDTGRVWRSELRHQGKSGK